MFQELPKKLISDNINNIHIALLTNADDVMPTLHGLSMEYFVKPGYVTEGEVKGLLDTLDGDSDESTHGAFTHSYVNGLGLVGTFLIKANSSKNMIEEHLKYLNPNIPDTSLNETLISNSLRRHYVSIVIHEFAHLTQSLYLHFSMVTPKNTESIVVKGEDHISRLRAITTSIHSWLKIILMHYLPPLYNTVENITEGWDDKTKHLYVYESQKYLDGHHYILTNANANEIVKNVSSWQSTAHYLKMRSNHEMGSISLVKPIVGDGLQYFIGCICDMFLGCLYDAVNYIEMVLEMHWVNAGNCELVAYSVQESFKCHFLYLERLLLELKVIELK